MGKISNEISEEELKDNLINQETEEPQEKAKIKEPIYEKATTRFGKKGILILTTIILAIIIVLSTIFALINIGNEKIISGIKADGISLEGLTREEAKALLNRTIEEKLNKEIKIQIDNNEEQALLLSQIELAYDIDKAIETAYKAGRNGNIFVNNFAILKSMLLGENIQVNTKYNQELLENVIKDIKTKIPDVVKEVSYCIEDDNLIITKGTAGVTIDEKEIKKKIEENMHLNSHGKVNVTTFKAEPKGINIDEIYNEVHTEAQDAYYTKNPFQIFPEVLGIDFNIEEAKNALMEEKDEYIIPLTITKPNKTVNNIGTEAFPDLLSTFSTRYDASNVPRTTNLRLAANKINGTVVMPGETFSYNKTVGKRTAEAGYREAAGYQGGKVVQMTGGGICQISSTLYDAVVYANLDIVERHNHAFTTSYVGAGKDATVVYGALDFKFKNTRKYPITIKASAQNGIAKVEIFGIKEDVEYEIDISTVILNYIPYSVVYENDATHNEGYEKVTQNGNQGCKSVTYKITKLNGAEVSRTVLSRDTYDAMNKYITRGTKKTAPINTEPVVPSEPEQPEPQPEEPATPVTPEEPTPQEPSIPENPTPGDENTEDKE